MPLNDLCDHNTVVLRPYFAQSRATKPRSDPTSIEYFWLLSILVSAEVGINELQEEWLKIKHSQDMHSHTKTESDSHISNRTYQLNTTESQYM